MLLKPLQFQIPALFLGRVERKPGEFNPGNFAQFSVNGNLIEFDNASIRSDVAEKSPYLVKGFVVRQQLMEDRYLELKQLVQVLGRTVQSDVMVDEQVRSVLDVVVDYTYGLDTLDRYDYQTLALERTTNEEK